MPFLIPLSVAESMSMTADMLTTSSAVPVIDKKRAQLFVDQLLMKIRVNHPEAAQKVLEHEGQLRHLISMAIDDYMQNQAELHSNDFYQMRMEDRLRLFGKSRARVGQIIENRTFAGMVLQMICNVLAAICTVIVTLPYSENYYRDLKYCISQLTVGILRDTIGAAIAAVADVAAVVSVVFLIIPRLFVSKEVVAQIPMLSQMQNLLKSRVNAYQKLWGNFAKQGLIFRLTFMQQDVKKMNEKEQLAFLRMYDRVNIHSKQYGINSEQFFEVIFGLINKDQTPERLESILCVMDNQFGYINLMSDESKIQLLVILADKFSITHDLDLDDQIAGIFSKVLGSIQNADLKRDFCQDFQKGHPHGRDFIQLDQLTQTALRGDVSSLLKLSMRPPGGVRH